MLERFLLLAICKLLINGPSSTLSNITKFVSNLKNIHVKLPALTCGDISDIQNITSTVTVHLLSTSSGLNIAVCFHDFINNLYAHMANIR